MYTRSRQRNCKRKTSTNAIFWRIYGESYYWKRSSDSARYRGISHDLGTIPRAPTRILFTYPYVRKSNSINSLQAIAFRLFATLFRFNAIIVWKRVWIFHVTTTKQFVCFLLFSNFTIKKSAIEKSYSEVSSTNKDHGWNTWRVMASTYTY